MNNPKDLIAEITRLTTEIETDYPELYRYLDENPLTLPAMEHPEMDTAILKNYSKTLQQLLDHYLEAHRADTAK